MVSPAIGTMLVPRLVADMDFFKSLYQQAYDDGRLFGESLPNEIPLSNVEIELAFDEEISAATDNYIDQYEQVYGVIFGEAEIAAAYAATRKAVISVWRDGHEAGVDSIV